MFFYLPQYQLFTSLTLQRNDSCFFRLQRLEELAEQTATHLAVIHRFMATNMDGVMVNAKKNSCLLTIVFYESFEYMFTLEFKNIK